MKKLLFTFFYLISTGIFAQFAKVEDKDGFVNLRKETSASSKILGKVASGRIVFIHNLGRDNEIWDYVHFYEGKNHLKEGYIHGSRLRPLDSYSEIPATLKTENRALFQNKNLKIEITKEDFDKKKNERFFSKIKLSDYTQNRYKGKYIYAESALPKTTVYKSVTVSWGGKTASVPKENFEGFLDVNLDLTQCYYNESSHELFIISSNGDGSEGYDVLFVFKNGKYVQTQVFEND